VTHRIENHLFVHPLSFDITSQKTPARVVTFYL